MFIRIQKNLLNIVCALLFCFLTGCTFISNLPFITGESVINKRSIKTNNTSSHLNDHPHPHSYSHSEVKSALPQNKKREVSDHSFDIQTNIEQKLESYNTLSVIKNNINFSPELTTTEPKTYQAYEQPLATKYTYTMQPNDTLYSIARLSKTSIENLKAINNINDVTQISVGRTIHVTRPIPKIKPVKKRITNKASKTASKPKKKKVPSWVWPTKGKISKKYNPKRIGGKGIRISAPKNTVVKASKKGEVVYSGNKIKGYGSVIIIKHDNQLISIYGFLNQSFVKKGDRVTKRQKIGTVGVSPDKKSLLHFEIHKNGQHTNPLKYIGHTKHF